MRLFKKHKAKRQQPVAAASVVPFEDDATERLLMMNGRVASRLLPRNSRLRNLADVEFGVFSQWGEDGIIEWLVAHLPDLPQRFIEFGVETFREANCRFLMMNRNWRGLVMDGSEENVGALRRQNLFWKYDLSAKQAFVTAENINDLLIEGGMTGPVGILSIDIDGNDYWVWEKITCVDPVIVICEYNPILGDALPISVPYDPSFTRFKAHFSGLYFGASIAALRHLAMRRGYEFVGTNSNGINAFFVRKDIAKFILPLLENAVAFPSRHRDSRDASGQLTFTAGASRLELIRNQPVVNVATGQILKISDIDRPYSDEWLTGM